MFDGKLKWIAEALGGVLLFLLPLKFGALVSVPAVTMIYWNDPVSIAVASWPFPVFPVFSGVFLLASLLFVPTETFRDRAGWLAGLWILLALASLPGMISGTAQPDGPLYNIDHAFAVGAFLTGFSLVVRNNPRAISLFHGIFTFSFLISLCMGLNQYFSGFQNTISEIESRNMAGANQQILARLQEFRVSGGFSACNAFAGYLVLALPVSLAWLWRAGGSVAPRKVSRILFTVPVFCAGVFLLIKTGSRGGLLSALAGLFVVLYSSKMPGRKRLALFSLIPLGIAGMTALVLLGRGGKSILFRLDYFQGAFRMMAESPLYGTGWGGFQRNFMKMKWICDAEAPASPHNFPLTFGSQAGVAGFAAACAILILTLVFLYRTLSGSSLKENFRDDRILLAGSLAGLAAWTVHSLQDVLYETPGAVVCYGAIGLLAAAAVRNGQTPAPEPKCLKRIVSVLLAVYAGFSLFIGWKVLSFDSALAALNDLTDYRMIPPEKLALIRESEVADAFENARKRKPDSPYPYLSVSDFYTARGDLPMAYRMNDAALKLDPLSAAFHMRHYRNLIARGQREEAFVHLKRAAELFPMNPLYRKMLEEQ